MESLFKLKQAERKFKGVVVAHDMTRAKRDECKKMVGEAKALEEDDPLGGILVQGAGQSRTDANNKNKKALDCNREAVCKLDPSKIVHSDVNNLEILYTNADGLVNKRQDLKLLLQTMNKLPQVIAITEFKPKKITHQLLISELNMEGYNIFYSGLK